MNCVFIFDTNATELKLCLQWDDRWLNAFLVTPVREHGQLGEVEVLRGDSVTPENVIKAIRSISVGSSDTLLVYYAGHGGISTRDRLPYFTMRSGELGRAEVVAEMSKKRPSLSVLMSECCSSPFDYVPKRNTAMAEVPRAANWDTIRQLFFDVTGRVSVTAVAPGQLAHATVFTRGFCLAGTASPSELAPGQTRVTWSRFLKQVSERSKEYYGSEEPCHPYHIGGWEWVRR